MERGRRRNKQKKLLIKKMKEEGNEGNRRDPVVARNI